MSLRICVFVCVCLCAPVCECVCLCGVCSSLWWNAKTLCTVFWIAFSMILSNIGTWETFKLKRNFQHEEHRDTGTQAPRDAGAQGHGDTETDSDGPGDCLWFWKILSWHVPFWFVLLRKQTSCECHNAIHILLVFFSVASGLMGRCSMQNEDLKILAYKNALQNLGNLVSMCYPCGGQWCEVVSEITWKSCLMFDLWLEIGFQDLLLLLLLFLILLLRFCRWFCRLRGFSRLQQKWCLGKENFANAPRGGDPHSL